MTDRLSRLGLFLIAAVFTVAVANAAARLTWTLSGQTGAEVTDIATALAAPSADRPIDIAPILALAPFGTAALAAMPQPAVQETALGLVLKGVAVADPTKDSIAVIASDTGVGKLYGLDDTVDGGAVLREVHADNVVLEVAGRLETLSFPKPGSTSSVDGIVAGIPDAGVDALAASVQASPGIEDFRRKIQENPKSLLDGFGVSAGGKGYVVDANATAGVLRAGFRPGDVIATINGKAVGDIERDRGLVDSVIASGRVRIEVVRDGRTVVMSFPLQ